MKNIYLVVFITFLMVACGNNSAENKAQNIESRPIEQMSSREAQLLGLDLKDGDGDDDWPAWTGPRIYSMEDAQRLAAANGKKVLVDVYAVWCGFCRKMAAETYPTENVKKTVEDYFYTVRLNAESEREIIFNGQTLTERELAAAFGVSSFPTTVFVDTDGEPLGFQPGFMDAAIFKDLIAYVGSNKYKSQSFDEFVDGNNN
jgi:thioredoxin-related protein